MSTLYYESSIAHHGVRGQKWGVRRYQNPDGSLTKRGKNRYSGDNYSERIMAKRSEHGRKLAESGVTLPRIEAKARKRSLLVGLPMLTLYGASMMAAPVASLPAIAVASGAAFVATMLPSALKDSIDSRDLNTFLGERRREYDMKKP